MLRHTDRVVKEVLLGILLWGIVGTVVVLIFWGLRDGVLPGFLLGTAMAAAYFLHMSITLETSLELMEKGLRKTMPCAPGSSGWPPVR